MKVAIFCPKFIDPQTVYMLMPQEVNEIVSAIGFDFCAEAVARRLRCRCDITLTVDEAILKADFIYVIWDGRAKRMFDVAEKAKQQGKKMWFSLLP